jgi:hypothetical protein
VKALVYQHDWHIDHKAASAPFLATGTTPPSPGNLKLQYQFFTDQELSTGGRLLTTGHRLLNTVQKHGEGAMAGYVKKVKHDTLISQKRVQDTYTELKRKFAKPLCEKWVEQTDPSKHVFEDLGIAAFLIELWKDMYQPVSSTGKAQNAKDKESGFLPPFPGFVDMGCGNGVLTEILLQSGYPGWGFDARKRKTWSILSSSTQAALKELVLIPQPLIDLDPSVLEGLSHSPDPAMVIHYSPTIQLQGTPPNTRARSPSLLARTLTTLHINRPRFRSSSPSTRATSPPQLIHHRPVSLENTAKPISATPGYHNGFFPPKTFLISNHADELTPWTPLLASISNSPFLAIPCCSHNLSGERFRAPSKFNDYTADVTAPAFFVKAETGRARAKSVAITTEIEQEKEEEGIREGLDGLVCEDGEGERSADPPVLVWKRHQLEAKAKGEAKAEAEAEAVAKKLEQPASGDLKALSAAARAKQPSAYAALCDWTVHLARSVNCVQVEREMLRIPSTRNVGIVGRKWVRDNGDGIWLAPEGNEAAKRRKVEEILRREKADGKIWVGRLGVLGKPGSGHG